MSGISYLDTIKKMTENVAGQTELSTRNNSILFVTSYYEGFLDQMYSIIPDLSEREFSVQHSVLMNSYFGDSDFYSQGMRKQGWAADDIVFNCKPLQKKWAKEKGLGDISLMDTLVAQIQKIRPTVLYLHCFSLATPEFISKIRQYTKLIVGQIASPVPENCNPKLLDLIFTSFPHFVPRFRALGIPSYYQPLGFDKRVWETLQQHDIKQDVPLTFVGGISTLHRKGYNLLETISQQVPLNIWGYGAEALPENSNLKRRHHGEVWGLDMFATLKRSKITLNRHIDVAENNANNMRLFEATGCGALLITDEKDNLSDLFETGKEIVTYSSPEEAIEKIRYYNDHPDEASKIAKAGQERTFNDHSYEKRMEQTAEILARHLKYQTEPLVSPMQNISTGHTVIERDSVTTELTEAWKSPSIPSRQRDLTRIQLHEMYHKNAIAQPYQVMSSALDDILKNGDSLLEIGCSTGYYSEVIEYLTGKRYRYTGVDYSPHLVDMARNYYPACTFIEADGANLPIENASYDVVISSCILLHVPNYREHIAETVRTANRWVVVHRTPICRKQRTFHMKKEAYGIETVELCFNERELMTLFTAHDLKLHRTIEYYANEAADQYEVTWVFEKINREPMVKNVQATVSFPTAKNGVYVNMGCGDHYHPDWINLDVNPIPPHVKQWDVQKGIPMDSGSADVMYHSNMLEHLPRHKAIEFIHECYRVLKPGGIIRIAIPDLEQLARNYLKNLDDAAAGKPGAADRYEWSLIELLDQMTRNFSGGEMYRHWITKPMPAHDYVVERVGNVAAQVNHYRGVDTLPPHPNPTTAQIAEFRDHGEIHQWMYDRYSIRKLLEDTGFVNCRSCRCDESAIPGLNEFYLDINEDGSIRKPDSIFIEARKK